MTRILSMTAAAGILACVLAAGSAQAAPVSADVLGHATATHAGSAVEQVYWRRYHHRWWRWHRWHRWHYYRYHRCWRCRYW